MAYTVGSAKKTTTSNREHRRVTLQPSSFPHYAFVIDIFSPTLPPPQPQPHPSPSPSLPATHHSNLAKRECTAAYPWTRKRRRSSARTIILREDAASRSEKRLPWLAGFGGLISLSLFLFFCPPHTLSRPLLLSAADGSGPFFML